MNRANEERMSMSEFPSTFSEQGQLLFLGRLARQHKVSPIFKFLNYLGFQNIWLQVIEMFCTRSCYLQVQSYEVVVLNQGGFEEKTVDLAKELLDAVLRWVFGLDGYLVDCWWMLGWSVE